MIRMKIHQRGYVLSPSVSFAIPSPIGKKIEKKKNLNAALAEKKIRFLEKDLTIHTFWNVTSVHHIFLISDFSVFFFWSLLNLLFPAYKVMILTAVLDGGSVSPGRTTRE